VRCVATAGSIPSWTSDPTSAARADATAKAARTHQDRAPSGPHLKTGRYVATRVPDACHHLCDRAVRHTVPPVQAARLPRDSESGASASTTRRVVGHGLATDAAVWSMESLHSPQEGTAAAGVAVTSVRQQHGQQHLAGPLRAHLGRVARVSSAQLGRDSPQTCLAWPWARSRESRRPPRDVRFVPERGEVFCSAPIGSRHTTAP
jgi:hypothetical protein